MNLPQPVIPKVSSFDQIRVKASNCKVKAAILGPAVPTMQEAVKRAESSELIEVVKEFDGQNGWDNAFQLTAEMKIDILIQGGSSSHDIVRHLDSDEAARGFFSHVAVLKPKKYPKLLLITDGAVNTDPDLKTKVALIDNLAKVARSIGIENPRIAPVAAVEAIYPQMEVTVEGAVLAKMSDRGQIKNALVDGPLSFDVAVDMLAAHSKGITTSAVAGQADALLASNVQVGRGLYEAMGLYCQAERGAIIFGGPVPIAVNEPFDDAETRYNSIVLAALCSQ